MTTNTLTLKKPSSDNRLEHLESMVQELLEQNAEILKLLKSQSTRKQSKPKTNSTGESRHQVVDRIFTEFGDGNNYNTIKKLAAFLVKGKWTNREIEPIRKRLLSMNLRTKHLKTFEVFLTKGEV